MKIVRSLKIFGVIAGVIISLSSCEKESENIFNMFTDVTVTFKGDHPFSVTDYKEVNDGDSVYIDYTVTSAKQDMYQINVLEVGSAVPFLRIPITDETKRRSFSGVVKLRANVKSGKTSYRVWPVDRRGVYMGDGYKQVTIDVKPNFNHISNRRVYLPDTVAKVLPCYFSIKTGNTYSYTTGEASSADIDFGIFRTSSTTPVINLYSLSANPLPFAPYNISTWTKRATLFSAPVNGHANTFNNTLRTGTIVETEARRRTINLRATTTGLVAGSAVYFLTPENKYGCILVNAVSTDIEGKPFINISVKVQN
ncbi:hypothetical protein [Pedobacter glucosidilyticus]|uniref:hypothetical protein n=1 Tax=Pedobacter glucosidilyticus TaxID=1122941 RepID=UPI0004790491|nr:hypothetical protein [Pedobacter glucosidilyticus]